MSVEKYKPKASAHLTMKSREQAAQRAVRAIEAGREAVLRARELLEDSQDAITRSRQLRGRLLRQRRSR